MGDPKLTKADDKLLNKALMASITEQYEIRDADGAGPYTCIRCLAGTWNDSDICDDCATPSPTGD